MSGEDSEFEFATPGEPPMDPQATENLLTAIFRHYAVDGNDGAVIITGARFFKLVRECGLMDSRVTQVLTVGMSKALWWS